MSMLLCKNLLPVVHERHKYAGQLFVVSAMLHGIFLLTLLVFYQLHYPKKFSVTVDLCTRSTNVVFVPLVKTVPGSLDALADNAQPVLKAKVAKQRVSVSSKHEVKKTPADKPNEGLKKNHGVATPASTFDEAKPSESVQNNKQPKLVAKKTNKSEKKVKKTRQHKIAPAEPKEVVVPIGRDDIFVLNLHEQVQKAVEQVWQPPVGLSKDVVCSIKAVVGAQGTVVKQSFMSSSAVISYDIAARTALENMVFPKALCGKEVIVTFKQ